MDELWHTIGEARDTYFVSYNPAGRHSYLAIVTLTYPDKIPFSETIAKEVENEIRHWMAKYNVPIMATARNATRDAIEFGEEFRDGFLFGHAEENGELVLHWGPSSDDSVPDHLKTPEHRATEYRDLSFTHKSEIEENQKHYKKIVQTGNMIVLFWFVIIPACLAVIGYFDWFFVGLVAMLYSLFRGLIEALRIGGYIKESERKKQKRAEELEMKHHHYHCQQNPECFARLKAENFKREDEAEALEKFSTLKTTKPNKAGDAR